MVMNPQNEKILKDKQKEFAEKLLKMAKPLPQMQQQKMQKIISQLDNSSIEKLEKFDAEHGKEFKSLWLEKINVQQVIVKKKKEAYEQYNAEKKQENLKRFFAAKALLSKTNSELKDIYSDYLLNITKKAWEFLKKQKEQENVSFKQMQESSSSQKFASRLVKPSEKSSQETDKKRNGRSRE